VLTNRAGCHEMNWGPPIRRKSQQLIE
jgi:hypothetical protein